VKRRLIRLWTKHRLDVRAPRAASERYWQTGLVLIPIVIAMILALTYVATQQTVWVEINGVLVRQRSHQRSADAILREMGITLLDEDLIEMPSRDALQAGAPIRLELARQLLLVHDGGVTRAASHALDVGGALHDTGVVIFPHDELWLEGQPCSREASLPSPALTGQESASGIVAAIRRPVRLSVRRGIPLTVHDGAIPVTFYTTARVVGEALYERGLLLYAGDELFPDQSTEITPGLQVYVERSKPLTLDIGGTAKMLRTRLDTVDELLQAEGIALGEDDYITPALGAPIERDLHIALVRVLIERYIEETPVAFETRWEPDAELEIDQRQTASWGQEGAQRRRLRVRYENDREVTRTLEDEWVAREPIDRVINYGTQIVLRQLDTPGGLITYWRHLRMLATSYNAPTAGKPLGHPSYGLTKLGWQAQKGVVAVDPRVIKLGQDLYVPGYGSGVAADTGSAIRWRRVDLCYDDDNLVLWHQWVDVYLLAPAPATNEINWIVPNEPRERE
jgi:uncharacterized protein YabE (DUF348 family)